MQGPSSGVGGVVGVLIMFVVRFEIMCLWLGFILGLISSVADFGDLCFKRYNFNSTNSSSVQGTVTVRGDANYTNIITRVGRISVPSLDPTQYNKWVKASFRIKPNEQLEIKASGDMSLCRAYLPRYQHEKGYTLPVPLQSGAAELNSKSLFGDDDF